MPDFDLSQAACDRRFLEALILVTEHAEYLDQATWGVTTQVEGFYEAIAHREWPCGTVACIAGTGAILAGMIRVEDENDLRPGEHCLALTGDALELLRANKLLNLNYMEMDFGGIGRLLFGLSAKAARHVFWDAQTVPELWFAADRATKGRVRLPEILMPKVYALQRAQ